MLTGRRIVAAALLAVLIVTAVMVASCGTRQPNLVPRTVLFGNPEKMRARISPSGDMLAYIAPVDDVLNVWVRTIGEDDDRAVTRTTTAASTSTSGARTTRRSSTFRTAMAMRTGGSMR
jgi:hypothetical protein